MIFKGYPPIAPGRSPTLQEQGLWRVVNDDLNIKVWSAMMKTTLTVQGLWDVVKNGIPLDPSKKPYMAPTLQVEELCRWRELVRKDMKALQILQSGLPDSVFRETLSVTSAKELWEMLEQVPDLVSLATCLAGLGCDEDMWMIHTHTTTNHMTPHEKYFTTLDRTRRAKVTFTNGSTVMAQGTGDVRILTRERFKLTIKDVLFVPGIATNVLSVGELEKNGDYDVEMGRDQECSIWDQTVGTMFGQPSWDNKRGFFLQLKVI